MKRMKVLVFTLVLCSFVLAQQKVGWNTGYYAGWASITATQIKWKTYTHMCMFSFTPNNSGACNIAMGLNDSKISSAITEAHKNSVKVLMCVGGAGTGTGFVASTANATIRATFIRNIITQMQKYGFDGVDMDWEELGGKQVEYVALHKELRIELDKITPRPLLTAAIANWMFNNTCAQISSSMDQMNNMSYWTRIINNGQISETAISNDMMGLVNKGVPKLKLGVGIGLDYEEGNPEVDCDPKACAAKCRFAIKQGYGGVMVWAIEKDLKMYGATQPCHDSMLLYTPLPVSIAYSPVINGISPVLTLVGNSMTGSTTAIRYSVTGLDAFVDCGVYDLRGALVTTLARGQAKPGLYTFPLTQRNGMPMNAGTYVVKLTANSTTQAAKATILK